MPARTKFKLPVKLPANVEAAQGRAVSVAVVADEFITMPPLPGRAVLPALPKSPPTAWSLPFRSSTPPVLT